MYIGYKDANTGERWVGDEIHPNNEVLCVSKRDGYYFLYNSILGKPFIRAKFTTKELAVGFGQFLHERYNEYFFILTVADWREADLISLFKWTVPNGLTICDVVDEMKEQNEIFDSRYLSRLI